VEQLQAAVGKARSSAGQDGLHCGAGVCPKNREEMLDTIPRHGDEHGKVTARVSMATVQEAISSAGALCGRHRCRKAAKMNRAPP